jgi:hypothetical protein
MELETLITQEVHQENNDPEIMAISEDGITSSFYYYCPAEYRASGCIHQV